MAFEKYSDLPNTFVGELGINTRTYASLANRYTIAVDDIARLALTHGLPPEDSQNEIVVYALDGDISDSMYDDYVHRLHLTFQPVPKGAQTNVAPTDALSPNVYYPVKKTVDGLREQAEHGLYLTAVSLRRNLPMEKMGPDATSFHAQNYTQLMHQFFDHTFRYKVDPNRGEEQNVQQLPEFWGHLERAYAAVVGDAAQTAATDELRGSFAKAAARDTDGSYGVADNLPKFTELSRDVKRAGERIKSLVKAIEIAGSEFGVEFALELMAPDIRQIAALGVINSNAYHDRRRPNTSFDRRLQWVEGNGLIFRAALNGIVQGSSQQFGEALSKEIEPSIRIVEQAANIALDMQPPNATFFDGIDWQIVRAR